MRTFRLTYSPTFDDQIDAIGGDEVRKGEAMRAVKDALSRNPFVGKEVLPGENVRMIFAHRRHGMPIAIYYEYDGGASVKFIGARTVGM